MIIIENRLRNWRFPAIIAITFRKITQRRAKMNIISCSSRYV